MIEPGLESRLGSQVTSVGGRVHPSKLPQNVTYPALTYHLVSDPRSHDHGGPDGLVVSRYQVTPWSPSYKEMKTARDEVRQALDGFTGTMNGHEVANIRFVGGPEFFDEDAEQAGVYAGPTDVIIQYREN